MSNGLTDAYERTVLARPWLSLAIVAVVFLLALSQVPKIKLDASADSLLLQGDPDLEFFREIGEAYRAEEFLLLTWAPDGPLLGDESLIPLRAMADELRALPGVSSVTTVWDVPLLESPPVGLSDITAGEGLPTLETPDLDRGLALTEFTTSPIYANLLVSEGGDLTAVQVNLARDVTYFTLLDEREELRRLARRDALDAAGQVELARIEEAFKQHSSVALEQQSRLVAEVRNIADAYRGHAQIFVGGVPMIASDMVSFVRSDLVLFGSAIIGVMLVVLALIFRRVRWVVIPLVTCVVTVTVMLGLLGFLDWRMTVISSNFVAVLLIITLAIAIHLIVRYRELHAEDPDGDLYVRVRDAVRFMAVPCLYTGATTVVAFVSLVVSGIQPVIDFGYMMTVGIVLALLLAFVIVPCMMLVWPKGRPFKYGAVHQAMTVKFAAITDKHGTGILLVTAVLVGVVFWGVSRLQVENRFIDYFKDTTEIYQGMELLDSKLGGTIPLDIVISAPDTSQPLPGLEAVAPAADATPVSADDEFAEDFDDFAPVDTSAVSGESLDEWDDGFGDDFGDGFGDEGDAFATEESFKPSYWFSYEGLRTIDAVHNLVDARTETGKVLSLSTTFAVVKDLLGADIGSVELALVQRSLPQDIADLMVNPYFSVEDEQARVTLRAMETSKELRRDAFLKELHKELTDGLGLAPEQVKFTGMLVLYNNVLQSLFKSQILTLGVVFLAITVMFWLLFRSLRLALIALAPNLLAAGLVLGTMGVLGIPLDIMTITIAAIVVGIGVDDCIHYVHRFIREFKVDRDYRQSMYRCHGSIGRAMYYTTITVVIGFSMLTLSNFNPSIYFGLLTVLAMVVAVLGALLLLPQLILVFKPLGPEGDAGAVSS